MKWRTPVLTATLVFMTAMPMVPAAGEELAAAERGREALFTRALAPAAWSLSAYDNLWKLWGLDAKPDDYEEAFRERYGLHVAPYANGPYPMGLREGPGLFSKGLTNDCMLCHAGSIFGRSIVGLGNASLDLQSLFEDLNAADGRQRATPFPFSNVRGTTEAAAVAMFLLSLRDKDLKLRAPVDIRYNTNMCEDVPAWWLLKKKKTIYHTGSTDARSVRTLMPFMLSPLNTAATVKKHEATFKDVQAFLLSLEAPKYPLPIDERCAAQGQDLFGQHCARCHGTYGPGGVYPNKLVALDVIGTDSTRALGIGNDARSYYNQSWFGQERGPDGQPFQMMERDGYQAPRLDGIWATAPYFHNGSVPTVYHVLDSQARPKIFTRSYRTTPEDYDAEKLGWKITVLDRVDDRTLPPIERRKIYDTSQPGRGNGGHTFGDALSEDERRALIEYLKTL